MKIADDFRLIETMRVSESGEVHLFERHLKRLSNSAALFLFKFDAAGVRAAILQCVTGHGHGAGLRLTLSKEGDTSLELQPLPIGHAEQVKLSGVRVDSNDVFLYHKTTRRGVYEQARRECDEHTDAILTNERGEITETTITNIAVFRDGQWRTPRLSCGLLPGVMREELLARSEIVEDVIPASRLQPGERIRCFNALRGVFDVEMKF